MTPFSARPGRATISRTLRCPEASVPTCTTRSTLEATVGTTNAVPMFSPASSGRVHRIDTTSGSGTCSEKLDLLHRLAFRMRKARLSREAYARGLGGDSATNHKPPPPTEAVGGGGLLTQVSGYCWPPGVPPPLFVTGPVMMTSPVSLLLLQAEVCVSVSVSVMPLLPGPTTTVVVPQFFTLSAFATPGPSTTPTKAPAAIPPAASRRLIISPPSVRNLGRGRT